VGESAVRVGLYGANGALGAQVIEALEGEGVEVGTLQALGGAHASAAEVHFRGQALALRPAAKADVDDMDLAVLAVPSPVAADLRGALTDAGVVVVDPSRGARDDREIPLWWPGLAVADLSQHQGVIAVAGPVSSTVAPVVAAATSAAPVEAVDAVVLLPAAASGRAGAEALSAQTMALLSFRMPDPDPLGGVLAFNVMAGSPELQGADDPWSAELARELPRLVPALGDAPVRVLCLRVPVFSGIAVALTMRVRRQGGDGAGAPRVWSAIAEAQGVTVEPGALALRDAVEGDDVLLRPLSTGEDGVFQMLLAADATRRVGYAIATLVDEIQRDELW